MRVRLGLEVLLSGSLHKSRRLGLITNHTGLDSNLNPSVDLLLARGFNVVSLFSPEHGLYGDHHDGDSVDTFTDPRTGIPVHSLYGDRQAPSLEMLSGLDALIFDIQDIGSRYYTYMSTMLLSMEAASRAGIRFVVLDRPNPLGGTEVEGNLTRPGFISFVSAAPVPIRHGMTLGEIARMMADERRLPEPDVVLMEGWSRDMFFDQTGLIWVPTSPNAPTLDMAFLYPGTCLIEGTNVSEGRGTALPFQMIGAPWVDGKRLRDVIMDERWPGVAARAAYFRPTAGKWKDVQCAGIQLHVTDRRELRPVELGVRLLFALRDLFPEFSLRVAGPEGRYSVDSLSGSTELKEVLLSGTSAEKILDGWNSESRAFLKKRQPYLLY